MSITKVTIAIIMMVTFCVTVSQAAQVHIIRPGAQVDQAIEIDGIRTQMNCDGSTWLNIPNGTHTFKDQGPNGGIETVTVNVTNDSITTIVMRGQIAVTQVKKPVASSTPSIQPTPTPTIVPQPTVTPTPTPEPTVQPTPEPTVVPTPQPTPTPTPQPTPTPTPTPVVTEQPHDNGQNDGNGHSDENDKPKEKKPKNK